MNKKIYNLILDSYRNLIDVENLSENEIEISLPIFLNTGDAVDIILEKQTDSKFILKNYLYSLVENSVESHIGFLDFRKKLLNKNKNLKKIKQKYILENNITDSLEQKKEIEYINDEIFIEEIFQYIFQITRYYNYIYDSIVYKTSPEDKEKIFKEEINNYIKNYNKKLESKFLLLKNNKYNLFSNNEYYSNGDILLVGTNAKIKFCEAILDIENIATFEKINEIIILYSQTTKTDLTKTYIKKVLASKENLGTFKVEEINGKGKQYEIF